MSPFTHAMASRAKIVVALTVATLVAVIPFLPGRYPQKAFRVAKRQWLISTGGMIDVGGYYLRFDCWGSGGNTVVFESGLSQPRESWGIVPDEVAKFARVCTYDRAGVGESDRAGFIRTSADVVRELRTLLDNAGEKKPFVLVGHSFGSHNARLFAGYYPEEIAGLVLVEPAHEEQFQRVVAGLSSEQAETFQRYEKGDNDERMDMQASGLSVRSIAGPSSVPAVLLTSEPPLAPDGTAENTIIDLQVRIIGRYVCSQHIAVPNAGHFIQLEQPQVLTRSIQGIVQGSDYMCQSE